MGIHEAVTDLFRDVTAFDLAMDSPSGDAEIDAACRMRDSAITVLRRMSVSDIYVGTALRRFDGGQDEEQ